MSVTPMKAAPKVQAKPDVWDHIADLHRKHTDLQMQMLLPHADDHARASLAEVFAFVGKTEAHATALLAQGAELLEMCRKLHGAMAMLATEIARPRKRSGRVRLEDGSTIEMEVGER